MFLQSMLLSSGDSKTKEPQERHTAQYMSETHKQR